MTRCSCLVLSLLLLAPLSSAQNERADAPPRTPFHFDTCLLDKAAAVPARLEDEQNSCVAGVDNACVSPAPEVAILAGEGDGRAFVRYGSELGGVWDDTSWAIEATVPFDEDDGEGRFGEISGLNGDLIFTPTFNHVTWPPLAAKAYATMLCTACRDLGVETLRECNPESLEELLRNRNIPAREIERTVGPIRDVAHPAVVGRAWTGEIGLALKEREFFESDGTVGKDDRIGYSLALGRSWLLKNGSIALEGTWKTDYDDADDATSCSIIEGTALEECKVKPRTRAAEEEATVLALHGKWLPGFASLAIAPRFEHDFETSNSGIQLPIYFLRTDEGALTGGLYIGWESDPKDDEENWSAAIFASKPLEF